MSSKFGAPTLRIVVKPPSSVFCGVGHAEDRAERLVVAHRGVGRLRVAELAADDVRVRVDESGQERRVAEVDDARAGGNRHRALLADGDDLVVGDDDDAVVNRRGAGAVDHSSGAKRDGAGALGFLRVARAAAAAMSGGRTSGRSLNEAWLRERLRWRWCEPPPTLRAEPRGVQCADGRSVQDRP